jgi:predicted dithiol-disulfide oxidoreductase (DUF899 family)
MRHRLLETSMAEPRHDRHFPNESKEYRAARDELLMAEREPVASHAKAAGV